MHMRRIAATASAVALLASSCNQTRTGNDVAVDVPASSEASVPSTDRETPVESSGEPSGESSGENGTTTEEPDTAGSTAEACSGAVERVENFEYASIDGVDPNLLSLDVHSPSVASDCPAVVWVHGGAWQVGDKANAATEVKAAHFLTQGYVFVSVNYRLAANDNEVRWPAFGNDVAAAAAWVVEHADEIGVDPSRIALMGHSAGGHLVSSVGTNPDLLGEFGLARQTFGCIASLDTDAYDLDTPLQKARSEVETAFGDDEALLVDGSPADQATEHADDGPLPHFLILTRGSAGRIARTEAFGDALIAAGGEATIVDVSPYTHRGVNMELGEPGEELVTSPVTEFFADCLR